MGEHTPQGKLKAEFGGLIFDAESRCIAATSNSKIDVARHLSACWNACAGFDTAMLEDITKSGETIRQRVTGMTNEIRRVNAKSEVLLKSLTNLVDRYVRLVNSGDAGNWDPEEEKEIIEARAAIKQATGEKS